MDPTKTPTKTQVPQSGEIWRRKPADPLYRETHKQFDVTIGWVRGDFVYFHRPDVKPAMFSGKGMLFSKRLAIFQREYSLNV